MSFNLAYVFLWEPCLCISILIMSRSIIFLFQFESYWSYDVCHGDVIAQYHKDTTPAGKLSEISVNRQDYVLGRLDTYDMKKLGEKCSTF